MLLVFELRQVLYVLLCAGLLGLGSLIWAVNRRSAPRQDASGSQAPSLLDLLLFAGRHGRILFVRCGVAGYLNEASDHWRARAPD
jgi:hypothetical protein